jgi:fructose-bisphosphate aldolase class I
MSEKLQETAAAMVATGKGILAADESTGTIKKRFDSIKVPSTEETRRDYREMLFSAREAMSKNISAVILFDETLRQTARSGKRLVDLIAEAGAVPGIKADAGAKDLAFHPGEKVTEGLDGLRERLVAWRELGARFAKWRAVIDIGPGIPTRTCISSNAHALARYAALCQETGIVPIVEPEVVMDGPVATHDIHRCYEVTEWTLRCVFGELGEHRVRLDAMVLKPNMVIAGKNAREQASPEQVAEFTLRCLKATVPPAVPGIAFLSGGQSDEQATHHLSLMNMIGGVPWRLTFSYGRALQAAPLKAWGGKPENVAAGQRAFAHRARMNALATLGKWSKDLEKAA